MATAPQSTVHKGPKLNSAHIFEADEIAKAHHLGHFFTKKLRIDAAKMHRLDADEKGLLNDMADIYQRAMKKVNDLGKHTNLTQLLTKTELDSLPNPVTLNAIEYLCHKMDIKTSELEKKLHKVTT